MKEVRRQEALQRETDEPEIPKCISTEAKLALEMQPGGGAGHRVLEVAQPLVNTERLLS